MVPSVPMIFTLLTHLHYYMFNLFVTSYKEEGPLWLVSKGYFSISSRKCVTLPRGKKIVLAFVIGQEPVLSHV